MKHADKRAPIEHPGQLGDTNKHLLDSIATGYQTALELAEQGFTILSVQAGFRNPVIFLSNSPHCEQVFNWAVKARYCEPRRNYRKTTIRVANYGGCQIQWRV